MPLLTIAGHSFTLEALTLSNSSEERLRDSAAAVSALFLEREREFSVHPSVVVDFPDLADTSATGFLADAPAYVARRLVSMRGSPSAIRIVVLTTYGDIVGPSFTARGYEMVPIDMPAGPDHTAAFIRDPAHAVCDVRTLYIEAVNEADEKIRPSFVLRLVDMRGQLCGGACGSIHERDGVRYAYLATMTLMSGMPQGSGTAIVEQLMHFLRVQRVRTVHLGTQTAGRFYEKMGFKVEHRLIHNLRVRQDRGQDVFGDLVMLSMDT